MKSNNFYQVEKFRLGTVHEVREWDLSNKIDEKTCFQISLANFCEVFNCVVLVFRFIFQEELADHIENENKFESYIDKI